MVRNSKPGATVVFDGRFRAPVDRRIFGGFLEHVGRAVYGGVFEPGGELADERGFRSDVLRALRRMGVTTVRYPGGNFASAYHWRDGVGPRQLRATRRDLAWEQLEPNTFGTDEFCAWCELAGAAPMLTVNLGDGTPEEAADWVAYCNADRHSAAAKLCRAGGREDPWRVRLWCLGNEMDGPWQIGHTSAEDYAARAGRAARLMRCVDPSVELVLAGSSGDFLPTYMKWDRTVLEQCWDDVDFLGIHRYSHNRQSDTAWFLAEGAVVDRQIESFGSLLRQVQAAKRSSKPVYLAIDEWNVWYRAKGKVHERGGWSTGAPLLQEGYNLEDALVVGQYLASFIRHADLVKLACLAQLVNALAPIVTTPRGLFRQTIYHPFAMFSRFARGLAAEPRIESCTYSAGERGEVPALDVAATFDRAAGRWAVFLTNRLIEDPLTVTLIWSGGSPAGALEAWRLSGEGPHVANTLAEPDKVVPVSEALPLLAGDITTVSLPPLSLTVLAFG